MRKLLNYFLLFISIALFFTGYALFSSKTKEVSFLNKGNSMQNNLNTNDNSTDKDLNINNNLDNEKSKSEDLDNETTSWFYIPNNSHTVPDINPNLDYDLSDYDAIYNLDTNKEAKTLYLTFDEGYENGYTSKILDILKEKNVKAVFFVTSYYLENNPDLIKRMVSEGHIVGNHSKSHLSMPTLTSDKDKFNKEFTDVENKYTEITGVEMKKLFRPPMGEYSQKSLSMTKNLGYKTVFWSFAYNDWDTENQPDASYAKNKILDNLHDRAILLLHAVSKTNTEILGDIIDSARDLGYKFKLIN